MSKLWAGEYGRDDGSKGRHGIELLGGFVYELCHQSAC